MTQPGDSFPSLLPTMILLLIYAAGCFLARRTRPRTAEFRAKRHRKNAGSLAILGLTVCGMFVSTAVSSTVFQAGQETAATTPPENGKAAEKPREDPEIALRDLETAILADSKTPSVGKYVDVIISSAAWARGEHFLKARIEQGKTAELHYQLGRIQSEKFRRVPSIQERAQAAGDSIDNFSKAIELNEKHWQARLARGIVTFFIPIQYKQMENAIADFEWLVRERPQLAVAHRYLAEAYVKLQDVARAREILSEAAKRFPEDEKIRVRLTQLAAGQK
jgi:tetratricopeptide (TPR) repeat protein